MKGTEELTMRQDGPRKGKLWPNSAFPGKNKGAYRWDGFEMDSKMDFWVLRYKRAGPKRFTVRIEQFNCLNKLNRNIA